jgi:peptidoglycan/xylan/chitin deacetylase (PgdA/CDA1 family)
MMTPPWFEEQLAWLYENGYTTLNTAELLAFIQGGDAPMKSVVLSFDLGVARHKEYIDTVIPTLRRFHMKAVFFVLVNQSVISDDCTSDLLFCWDEMRQWQAEGLITVESHGVYHPDYTKLSAAEIKYDAGEAKKIIEAELGTTVLAIAYPYDSYSSTAAKVVKDLGYMMGFAGNSRRERSVLWKDPDPFQLPRVYPYSNSQIYPAIYGTDGKNFGQVMGGALQERVADLAQAELTAMPPLEEATPSIGEATATPTVVALTALERLVEFCRTHQPAATLDYGYLLDQLAFQTDLSPQAVSALPYGVLVRPSCNFVKENNVQAIVLHYTDDGTMEGAIDEFRKEKNTSAHYIIDRDGMVFQVVQEQMGAFHSSCYGYRSGCVATCPICDGMDGKFIEPYTQSIGIELVNRGYVAPEFTGLLYTDYLLSFGKRYWEDYPEAQIAALKVLVADIRARYGIPWELVMGHYMVNEKVDPGPALNLFWPRNGFPPREPIFDIATP